MKGIYRYIQDPGRPVSRILSGNRKGLHPRASSLARNLGDHLSGMYLSAHLKQPTRDL